MAVAAGLPLKGDLKLLSKDLKLLWLSFFCMGIMSVGKVHPAAIERSITATKESQTAPNWVEIIFMKGIPIPSIE